MTCKFTTASLLTISTSVNHRACGAIVQTHFSTYLVVVQGISMPYRLIVICG